MLLIHTVSGDLTLDTVSMQLADGIEAINQGCVEFDLSRVVKLDSAALAFILVCQRMAISLNRQLRCTHLPENLKNLATLYGVAPYIVV